MTPSPAIWQESPGRVAGRPLKDSTLKGTIFCVSKIRRGNYVFLTWSGDHLPRHVHVYKDREFVVKWNLDDWVAMEGEATRACDPAPCGVGRGRRFYEDP